MVCYFFVFTGPNFQFLARILTLVTESNRFPTSCCMVVVRHLHVQLNHFCLHRFDSSYPEWYSLYMYHRTFPCLRLIVSRRRVIPEAWLDPRPVHLRSVVQKAAFLRILRFYLVIIIPPVHCTHSSFIYPRCNIIFAINGCLNKTPVCLVTSHAHTHASIAIFGHANTLFLSWRRMREGKFWVFL